jgi:hypothetical protein
VTINEQKFIQRYKDVIKECGINITIKELLSHAINKFLEQKDSLGNINLIDIGMERYLCEISPLFFIENYCYIELKGYPAESAKKMLYYFQREIIKTIMNYKKVVFTKTRQAGLSTLNALIIYWKTLIFPSQWAVIISKDQKSSQDFLDKIKINLEYIPEFLETQIKYNNVKSLVFTNKSKIEAMPRSKTAGRGTSATEVVLDEAGYFETNTIVQGIVASVNAALSRTGGRLTIISTPNGSIEGSEGYWYWQQVNQLEQEGGENKKDKSKLYYIDWWMVKDLPKILPHKGYNDKLKEFEDRDYYNDYKVYLEARKFFDPIAKDWKNNDWLRNQYKTSGPILYRQEILRDFVILQSTVFTSDILESIQTKIKEPIIKDMCRDRPMKNFWIWKEPQVGHKYAISADVASGTSLDSSAVEILDTSDYSLCAEYVGKITTIDFAHLLNTIGYYYNTAMIFLESNSIGLSTFTVLNKDLNYPNLYKEKRSQNGVTTFVGWTTTSKTRQLIMNKLIETLYDPDNLNELDIPSERLLGQLKTLVFTEGGRAEAIGSAHDDAVMSYAIGLYNVPKAGRDNMAFFLDEEGRQVSVDSVKNNEKVYDTNSVVNRTSYLDMEEKMVNDAGVGSLEDLKWLLG